MAWTVVLAVLAASPPVGSSWRWSIENVASGGASATVGGTKRRAELRPTGLSSLTLGLKVLEVSEGHPSRFELTVLAGPHSLRGRRYVVERDYDRARLTLPDDGASARRRRDDDEPDPKELNLLRQQLAELVAPDPFVAAIGDGPRCAAATLERVAAATPAFFRLTDPSSSSDLSFEKAEARCLDGGKRYAVSVTAKQQKGSAVIVMPIAGTVDVPVDAWKASLDLTMQFDHRPEGSRTGLKAVGTLRIRNRLTPR